MRLDIYCVVSLLCQACILTFLSITVVEAQDAPDVCTGYNPDTGFWGGIGVASKCTGEQCSCPVNHAYVASSGNRGVFGPGKYVALSGDCCPLADDILLDRHEYHLDRCPPGSVATGSREEGQEDGKKLFSLRCTRINESRYQLSEESPGVQWGLVKHFRGEIYGVDVIGWSQIPVGWRYGIGRAPGYRPGKRHTAGCIAYPFGGLLVAKVNKSCAGIFFRQLKYRGLPGDPPAGTTVKLFPDCRAISDPLDKNAKCIK